MLAPKLALLTRAPDAPPPTENPQQQQLDKDMASVAVMRLKGKLDPLLPQPVSASSITNMAEQDRTDLPMASAAVGMHR